jgi:tripartite-type tricarboxylate transporter receptor subunit TctC
MLPAWSSAADKASANWPTKPIRLLVGFPGGSSPDVVARILAEPLSKALGQPVVVDNRPGASGNIAADLVARATDQHTLGVMINGNLTIAKLLNPRTPYDPAKDLAPISLVASAPLVLTAPSSAPGHTPQEFFAAAQAAGNRWNYGSPGVGTVAHIGMELLNTNAGLAGVHVPYPGNPQVITAMLGGQVQLALLPPGLAMAQVRSGKLKAIGVTSAGRSTLVPELPSLGELGVVGKDFQLEIWDAVAAPASLPKPLAAKLAALLSEIARSPEVRDKLYQQGWQVVGSSAEGLANRMKADTTMMGRVIAARGIKVE